MQFLFPTETRGNQRANANWTFNAGPGKANTLCICLILTVLSTGISIAASLGITEEMLNLVTENYGRSARGRILLWQRIVDNNQHKPEIEKLNIVNNFFNKNGFVSDSKHWNQADYWATPIEFLSTKAGDCEDFAIAKYITLIALQVDNEKLRITYVKASSINQAHMVLTYYASPSTTPLVLDNLVGTIEKASDRPDLIPVYSFNGEGLWLAKMRDEGQNNQTTNNLNMWRDLIARLKRERSTK
jgi:predicted transglutaminase-like cysteine proteinase